MKRKENVQLTDDVVKNIQIMAPHLSKEQQYVVFGMILSNVSGKMDITFIEKEKVG